MFIVAYLQSGCKVNGLIGNKRHAADTFPANFMFLAAHVCYNTVILSTESERQMKRRKWIKLLAYDLAASWLLGVSIVVFAVRANFAPGGVSGLAVIANYLTGAKIGLMTVLINIPIIVLTFRRLGLMFFVCSVKIQTSSVAGNHITGFEIK